jgi:hypothetical protein
MFNHHYPQGCGEPGEGEDAAQAGVDPTKQVNLTRCGGNIWFNATHLSSTP